jgi:hypothetical protein
MAKRRTGTDSRINRKKIWFLCYLIHQHLLHAPTTDSTRDSEKTHVAAALVTAAINYTTIACVMPARNLASAELVTAARNYISIACVIPARNYITIARVMPARNRVSGALVTAARNYISIACAMTPVHRVSTTEFSATLNTL